jgi:hypothetical protein
VRGEAHRALRQLAGQDFGPAENAEEAARGAAIAAWKEWNVVRELADRFAAKSDEEVLAALDHPQADERRGAVQAVRTRKLPTPHDLIRLLADSDRFVRREAHVALVQLAGGKDLGPAAEHADQPAAQLAAATAWQDHWQQQRERQAEAELRAARELLQAGRADPARDRLRRIQAKFPDTLAAAESRKLLDPP